MPFFPRRQVGPHAVRREAQMCTLNALVHAAHARRAAVRMRPLVRGNGTKKGRTANNRANAQGTSGVPDVLAHSALVPCRLARTSVESAPTWLLRRTSPTAPWRCVTRARTGEVRARFFRSSPSVHLEAPRRLHNPHQNKGASGHATSRDAQVAVRQHPLARGKDAKEGWGGQRPRAAQLVRGDEEKHSATNTTSVYLLQSGSVHRGQGRTRVVWAGGWDFKATCDNIRLEARSEQIRLFGVLKSPFKKLNLAVGLQAAVEQSPGPCRTGLQDPCICAGEPARHAKATWHKCIRSTLAVMPVSHLSLHSTHASQEFAARKARKQERCAPNEATALTPVVGSYAERGQLCGVWGRTEGKVKCRGKDLDAEE
ncbi:hypothetical protein B0H19DRAFT_1241875 [Mycena capillaripes]|nr:hypothetical protein B0H19DRAFT_1241875 [Mycena capillaripes]